VSLAAEADSHATGQAVDDAPCDAIADGPLTTVADRRRRVYVRGARSALGWRVADALGQLAVFEMVVASGDAPADASMGRFDVVVDVGLADHDLLGRRGESVTAGAQELLADADVLGADELVVLSSAMVYGARANNPVPLTEEAVLRPDPTFVFARQLAAAEEAIEGWRAARPRRRVAMLRPVVPIAAEGTSSLARALTAGFGQRFAEADPGAQFVHHDDVASAVSLAVERRLDGVFNVAPDGSIPGDRVRALSGRRLRLPLPERVADVVGALRWRFQRGPIPPGLRSYTRDPWVVANDKLRAEGWAPTVTNEQAYVEGTEAKWWTMITPKRRQELSLAAMAIVVVGVVVAGGVMGRRWWRRRDRT
jgi:nucleoside-diphosphate-sugar epimerase